MPNTIWEPRPKLEKVMPWKITKQNDGTFCVVKESDGKTVKCHPTREKAKSHLAALYVNEPSAAKKSTGYGLLKSLITERVEELKGCGANKPGGGGFSAGNTCARGGGSSSSTRDEDIRSAAGSAIASAKKARTKTEHQRAAGVHSGLAAELAGKYGNLDPAVMAHRAAANAHKEAAKNLDAASSQAARSFSAIIPKIR